MDCKRGFFRIWIVVAVIWVGIVAFYANDAYQSDTRSWRHWANVPVSCEKVRGSKGTDYGYTDLGPSPWPTDIQEPPPVAGEPCWYRMPNFRTLYPEYADMTDSDLLRASYRNVGKAPTYDSQINPPSPWPHVGIAAGFAIVPPVFVLVVACLLAWIIAGFRRSDVTERSDRI